MGLSKEFCEIIASVFTLGSVIEYSLNKPGNASRFRDINSVDGNSFMASITMLDRVYLKACLRGLEGEGGLFNDLPSGVEVLASLGLKFHLLGTALTNVPLVYVLPQSVGISDALRRASSLIKRTDSRDYSNFSKALTIEDKSYLGKLEFNDFRTFSGTLYEALEVSKWDSVVYNILNDYVITRQGIEEIKLTGLNDDGILRAFLRIISFMPDGLVYRKHGAVIAQQVSIRARYCLQDYSRKCVNDLDSFLISSRINPGSSADILSSSIALYRLEKIFHEGGSGLSLPLRKGCDRIF